MPSLPGPHNRGVRSRSPPALPPLLPLRLGFVPESFHLDLKEEVRRYRQHNNDPMDKAYRTFLEKLLGPLRRYLPERSCRGLDYGSGPGPAISAILAEEGHEVCDFDPLFAPRTCIQGPWDFVTCTEVVEHFAHPLEDWKSLMGAASGGLLGIMTHILTPDMDFPNWYYKNDPTHIAFYAPETFRYIARAQGAEILEMGERHVIFAVAAAGERV